MTYRPGSIADLTRLGADELAHFLEREHPPGSPLEWLGIAVGRMPELAARARTADEVHWHSRSQAVRLRVSFLDSLMDELGIAAALIQQARDRLVECHGAGDGDDGGAEIYAELLEAAHRSAPRRAEMMIAGYASFLGAAIEAGGVLADAELARARPRRWERNDPDELVAVRVAQLHSALSNALGGLLAYARLVAEDSGRIED